MAKAKVDGKDVFDRTLTLAPARLGGKRLCVEKLGRHGSGIYR